MTSTVTPLSEKAERIGDIWYFVTYQGEVQPVRAEGGNPQLGKRWWLADAQRRADGWRPAGWHGKAAHDNGSLWVAMTPQGYNGSHKDPATEVWQFNASQGTLVNKVTLVQPGLSIAVSKGDKDQGSQLLVVNLTGGLDVYDAVQGDYLHSINALGDTPYIVHAID